MNISCNLSHSVTAQRLPRAWGTLRLSSKTRNGNSFIDDLYSAGCARAVFPRRSDAVEAIVVNTSGGLTGGDTFNTELLAGSGSRLVMTTQAAERAYKSMTGLAHVRSCLKVEPRATLHWLPQEFLVFDNAAVDRRLDVDLADETAEFVMAEPVVFGRTAMSEVVRKAIFLDMINVRRGGRALYGDRIALTGNIQARLGHAASACGMQAMASALYVGNRAEHLSRTVRDMLPATGGASLLRRDVLAVRILQKDGFLLRSVLCPILEALTDAPLPRPWRL